MLIKNLSKHTSIVFLLFSSSVGASFYQAGTMAAYCQQYVNLIELKSSVNQLEAGVCSGYIASAIEIMDLSSRLCQREKLNLNAVARQYIDYIEQDKALKEESATYVLINVLQKEYACKDN